MAASPGMSPALNPAAAVHRGDAGGVRVVLRFQRDAVPLAVGVDGGDAQLLRAAEAENLLQRLDLDGRHRRGTDAITAALHDPAPQTAIAPDCRC